MSARILLISNELPISKRLKEILSKAGFSVEIALTEQHHARTKENSAWDLILSFFPLLHSADRACDQRNYIKVFFITKHHSGNGHLSAGNPKQFLVNPDSENQMHQLLTDVVEHLQPGRHSIEPHPAEMKTEPIINTTTLSWS